MELNYKTKFTNAFNPLDIKVSFISEKSNDIEYVEQLIRDGFYEEAKRNVLFLKIDTPDTSAYDGLSACIDLYLDDYEAAYTSINSYISMLDGYDLKILEILIRMIYILLKKNDYDEGIKYCEMTVDFLSNSIEFVDLEESKIFRRKLSKFHDIYKILLALNQQTLSKKDVQIIEVLVENIISQDCLGKDEN